MQTIEDLKQYTFKALLENSIKKFEKEKALSLVDGEPISYRELYEKSLVISNLLKNSGLKKGERLLFIVQACHSGALCILEL